MAGMRRATDFCRKVVARHCTPASGFLYGSAPLHTTTQCTGSPFVRSDRVLAPTANVVQASSGSIGVRLLHTYTSEVPQLSDPKAKEALNILLATNWSAIEKDVSDLVKAAVAKGGADAAVLSNVWSSAQASGKFADILIALRMELDNLSGADGESVRKLPDSFIQAMESAYKKYMTYLEAIGEDEGYLKKKVENDLGSILIQMKQRCGGMEPKWGKITLLGTSGLYGSYIELRHT